MPKKITNFALNLDKETLEQFKSCYKEKYVVKASLMPDAHKGYVAPIGSVLVTKKYVVPSWVGYDIGCGMTAVKIKSKTLLKEIKSNTRKIYNKVKKNVPIGVGEINPPGVLSLESKKEFDQLIEDFKKGSHDKSILNFLKSGKAERHLGSLGHGNHFIALYEHQGFPWIVVHCGSRGVGHKAAKKYMITSSGSKTDFEQTHPLDENSQTGKEYLNLLDFGLSFALLNRIEIIRKVISSLESVLGKKIRYEIWTNKNHNHAIKERGLFIHRKGATPAKKGERGVIPGNMRDGSFLVEGKGNSDFLSSSSHGAGRALSRRQARDALSLQTLKKQMQGVFTELDEKILDESPDAYKNIFDVLDAQKKSIKVVAHLKPIINWQR